MAYVDANLVKVAEGGNGKTLWWYHTTDATTDVDGAGYFTGEAVTKLKVGDVIIRSTYTSAITGAISTCGLHFVNANDGTTVDIADTLAVTATDSD